EAARALTYETARVCDLENNNLRVLETNPPADQNELKERKNNARIWKRLNGMLTPMSKYYASEMCVRVANDALQVLGGSGYMKDYPVERHLRDARITTIYEGTSQMQVVAAVRGVCGGAFEKRIARLEQREYFDKSLHGSKQKLAQGKQLVLDGVAFVKEQGVDYMDLHGRRLVDSAIAVLVGHLLLEQADADDRKKRVARRFIETNLPTIQRDIAVLRSGDKSAMEDFETLAGPPVTLA
ncbi:MAG: acyl-CoA dehydrogenase family protein, partial [Phycisphaerae bacterium]